MAAEFLWRCEICGYVHQGAAAPDRCPVCFAGPEAFTLQGPELPAPAPLEPGARIVVVGAGAAGLAAAEEARRRDATLKITLLSAEECPPYWRLELTRYLAGETRPTRLALREPAWYADQRIELQYGEALGVDRAARRLLLEGGASLPYDRLILATGAHPVVPALPGLRSPRVHRFRTRADAELLLWAARPGARALCLGGGLLGLESAAALARRGMHVQVLEAAPSLLPRQLAPEGSALLAQHLSRLGVEARTGTEAAEATEARNHLELLLRGGESLSADFLLLAVGVTPETYLAREAGLEVDRGIRVDDSMATSDPAIFACGDVAEHAGVLYGLWEAALVQGAVAGANAAGGAARFNPLPPATLLKVVGLELFSCGAIRPAGPGWIATEASSDRGWQRLVWRENVLAGANLVGDARAAALLREAIAGAWDPARLTAAAPPGLAPALFELG